MLVADSIRGHLQIYVVKERQYMTAPHRKVAASSAHQRSG